MHMDATPDLKSIVKAISKMSRAELDVLQTAIDQRRGDVQQSTVAERRSYRDGVLQAEYRRNPASGTMRGPYWYFKFREGGRQHTVYVGRTNSPEALVDEKLRKDES
jgi:hypothetical protein